MANESKTAQLMRDYQTMLKGMKAKWNPLSLTFLNRLSQS
jgi:hypothetical protein